MNSKSPTTASILPALAPLSIIRMFWKHKIAIAAIWTIVAGGTFLFVHKMPARYTAEALILVDSQKIPEKFVSSTVSTELQDRIASISQQILSSTRLKKVIEEFDLYHEERKTQFDEVILEMMRRDISIRMDRGVIGGGRPGAFRVGFDGSNPSTVAQVANRLANLLIDENLKTREVQAEGTSEFITTQLQEAKKTLDDLEASLSRYKVQHNGELPQQESFLEGALSRLQTELESNRDGMNRAQQTKVMLENTQSSLEATEALLAGSASARPAGAAPGPAQPLPRIFKQSEVMQLQLDQLRTRYGDDHPDVKRARQELARQKAIEEKAAAEKTSDPPAKPSPETVAAEAPSSAPSAPNAELLQTRARLANIHTQIGLVTKEMEFRKGEEQRILKNIAVNQGRLGNLPVREQEIAQVVRDYEISKANYRSLLDKRLAADMSTDMERRQKSERFTLLDPAQVPERPTKPNRPLLNGFGCGFGLVLALAVGFGLELKKNVLLGEWELPAGTAVLARLPHIDISGKPAPNGGAGKAGSVLRRKVRIAILSSAVLSLLGVLGAVVYYASNRF